MSIHTFGDSHALEGWGNNIIEHYISSILCYSFGVHKLNRIDIRNFDIKDGDSIIFCFGEVDCRCHIYKHITDTNTYQNIIDNIINNYFDAIQLNISVSQIKFKNICVYNVVPPVEKYNTSENHDYPYLGTDEERKNYVLYFNKKIKEYCIKYNYIFFDIYDKYIDENGFLNKDLSDGHVHIKDGIHITNFIKDNNI